MFLPSETKAAPNLNTLRTRKYRKNHPRKFVGVDGEGQENKDGRHIYTMLRAGDKVIVNPYGLTTYQCLAFLADLDPHDIYVAFAFNYDVTMMLHELSEHKLTRLCKRELRRRTNGFGYMPVDWRDEFDLDWMPSKEFRVRRKGGKWIVINDVWGFFQGSFMSAITKWDIGTEAERAKILEGKQARGNFEDYSLDYVDEYNALECVLLAQLMDKFSATCEEVGYVPRKWQGAGQLSEAIMAAHGCPKTKHLFDEKWAEVWEYGRKAYYGGRFEIAYVGNIPDKVYQYDINSAYIDAMVDSRYPCLLHGEWKAVRAGTAVSELSDIAILEVIFARPERRDSDFEHFHEVVGFGWDGCDHELNRTGMFYPLYTGLPVRKKDGCIYYPHEGKGWYWSFEIEASIHQKFRVLSGWEYVRNCDCKPMGFMAKIYRERLRLGKDGKGLVLKTGMNSAYGKKVQSVGSPKYSNPIEGSFITAHCREKIQRLIHALPECGEGKCGESVVFVATDAVATTVKAPVPLSKDLGDWSLDIHESGIFQIQPGLYFGSKQGFSMRTRGVPVSLISDKREQFERAMERLIDAPDPLWMRTQHPEYKVIIWLRNFIGLRLALAQNKLDDLGQWPEVCRLISFAWFAKRGEGTRVGHNCIKLWPWEGKGTTIPYDRNIGGLDDLREIRESFEDMPDWARVIEGIEG